MGFYCENCGNEVKRNTDSCPECGVSFKAVKCPSCGFTDKADYFKEGCPSCGYMAKEEKIPYDNHYKKKERKPFLGFIPASFFWLSSLALLGILLTILRIFLK